MFGGVSSLNLLESPVECIQSRNMKTFVPSKNGANFNQEPLIFLGSEKIQVEEDLLVNLKSPASSGTMAWFC